MTITPALLSLGVALLWTGCDYNCPSGYERRDDECVAAPASADAGKGTSEGELRAKADAGDKTAMDSMRSDESKDEAGSGGRGGEGGGSPAAHGGNGSVDGASAKHAADVQGNGGAGGADVKRASAAQGADMQQPSTPADSSAADGGSGSQPPAPPAKEQAGSAAPAATPSFASGGGAVLKHPDVALLFWGPAWAASPPVTPGQIAGALQHMFVGPYFANLNQYGDVVKPLLTWVSVDSTTPIPSAGLSSQDVTNYISARLDANAAPALGGEQLFIVVLPPGVAADRMQGERGVGKHKDATYRYAWVASGSTLSDASSATYSVARHIIGSMTNPGGDGWTDANSGKELSDVCGWTMISGAAHPQYWSNADGRCVVPREYGTLLRYDGMPNAWTAIWTRVRFAACGGYGLVATNADDNIFKYSGQPNSWVQIGLPGAVHVVSSDTVFGLTPDLSAIYRYTGSDQVWYRVADAHVNMYAGGFGVFATELGSNRLKKWSGDGPASTVWTDFGDSGASFAVGADFIAGIPPNHSAVFRATADANWTQIKTTGANQLYTSGSSTYLAATDRTQLDSIYLFQSGTSWARQGDPGYAFALTKRDLFGLTPARWGVFQSADLTLTNPSWTQISDSLQDLVPGCESSLYALSGLVQCDEGVRGSLGSSCSTTIGP